MRIFFISQFLIIISLCLQGQDCNILSKANSIVPDRLCSPLSVNWKVSYTGVNNAGTSVQISYDWDDGSTDNENAVNLGAGVFQTIANHTYVSTGNKCNYRPKATLVVNGVFCSSSTQEQIVTVWDNDDHNGGHMHISPAVYPVCFGNSANVRFQDLTQFNCVPPQEQDVPNLYTRWVQWIYGTDNTMTGLPVTINGALSTFPFSGPIITLPGPVTGSGVYSDIINVANDKLIGQYFQVTLRNWNYCNPYDDPNIPGPPADPVNGDHPPVVTTAIILIVPYPDATINPVDTLCVDSNPVTLKAHDSGGTWSGDGVSHDKFDPGSAGVGNHIISYNITDANGCSDSDKITITVMPLPTVTINPVGTLKINAPPVELTASPPGGSWTGDGVTENKFIPDSAGLGMHVITYLTLPDKFGCVGTDTIHIKVIMPPGPVAIFEPDTVGCTPLKVQFRNKSENAESYLWDFGDKTFSSGQNPSHTYNIPGNYIVELTVTNFSGQTSKSGLITVYQKPTAIFSVYPTQVINNSQVVVFTDFSYDEISWLWNFGDGSTSVEESPWHKYETQGIFKITLTVTSKDGCTDSATYKSPVVVDYQTGTIRFPNVFKWNGSGPTGGYWNENELDDNTFRPFFTNVIDYNLQIFNRWGVLIYESSELKKGWDGYFGNANLALQGVYVWKAIGRYADGTYFNKVGDVTFLH
ncbi:MAG: PKD domain-containing protein [Bacteroidales bacterium]